ncbi:hypothetical protein CcaCcLH18_12227 [Colletotrichum camelliae]|nr:hypothetical protein CcaCcLH18_12227 [Colletotrichum camelliae]
MVTKSGSPLSTLPYELFLNIVEALIASIEEVQAGEIASAHYRHDVPCKLAVSDEDAEDPFARAMKKRYRDLRLPLQINQQSRKMVYRTFRPIPMFFHEYDYEAALDPILPVSALVLPEVDAFIPYHSEIRPEFAHREAYFHQTIHLPSPTSYAILDLIQIIYLPAICHLSSRKPEALEALLALPSLKYIMANIGLVRIYHGEVETFHGGRRLLSLDYRFFPHLYYWDMDRNFHSIWSRFQKKGIKLYGIRGLERRPRKCLMEIFPSEDGALIQYVNPNCPCCPRLPMSERRKLAAELRAEMNYEWESE